MDRIQLNFCPWLKPLGPPPVEEYAENAVGLFTLQGARRFGAVGDPDQEFGGAVKLGDAKKVFTCLNTEVCLGQMLGATQKWLPFVGQKVAIFVGRTMQFFRDKPQFESALYH